MQLAHAARLRGRRQDSEFHLQVAGAERIRDVLGWEPSLNDLDTILVNALSWEKRMQKQNRSDSEAGE
jgi:UDP-glucose 4-epimerase